MPVCTDLLTIGDGTVIRKDSFFTCYRAQAGVIQTGAVTLGRDVFVGEATVLDIETSLGDGAQLGHSSSLHPGQAVPGGERWHGSPASRPRSTTGGSARATAAPRRTVYAVAAAADRCWSWAAAGGRRRGLLSGDPAARGAPGLAPLAHDWASTSTRWSSPPSLFFGAVLVGLAFVLTVPRVLNLAIEPDRVYPLYGFHYGVHRTIARMTNLKFFTAPLRRQLLHRPLPALASGTTSSEVEQTGSNFGRR